mmetsp:Transcript_87261/g.227628  ORF Transcript_87261/g.227628 Transcript_87261/m.227628 type:complete len:242 (-) Transcript_87261:46-771(-)
MSTACCTAQTTSGSQSTQRGPVAFSMASFPKLERGILASRGSSSKRTLMAAIWPSWYCLNVIFPRQPFLQISPSADLISCVMVTPSPSIRPSSITRKSLHFSHTTKSHLPPHLLPPGVGLRRRNPCSSASASRRQQNSLTLLTSPASSVPVGSPLRHSPPSSAMAPQVWMPPLLSLVLPRRTSFSVWPTGQMPALFMDALSALLCIVQYTGQPVAAESDVRTCSPCRWPQVHRLARPCSGL